MLVLRGLRTIWRNATQYAQEYYDKLNEIRIITGRSEADVARLGQSYRALAKQMNVSSTEIATAAVEFWRQGLQEDEVNQRLYASIQYAKISAMEFDQAAELITAATNTWASAPSAQPMSSPTSAMNRPRAPMRSALRCRRPRHPPWNLA